MAWLPPSANNNQWSINDIGDDVCIIENPGLDNETVHFRYPGKDLAAMAAVRYAVQHSKTLTEEQKFYTSYWMGYFYAHMR